jgi:hypothetical protein
MKPSSPGDFKRGGPAGARRFLGVAGVIAALLGGGCASSDLSNDATITQGVVECLPTDAPAPSMIARSIWFPNASGFGSTDASPLGHITGVLALSGDKLYFMSWNSSEHHFDSLRIIAVLTAKGFNVVRLGTSAMLVAQSGNDSFDAFELMNGGSIGSDPKVTQEFAEKLKALQAQNPP